MIFLRLTLLLLLCTITTSFSQGWSSGWNTMGIADRGTCIKADRFGNVYATGNVWYTSAAFDTITDGGFIAKWNSAGDLLWARPAGNFPAALTFDNSGNICVTGTFAYNGYIGDTLPPVSGGINRDIFTAKFDTSGELIWAHTAGGDMAENSNAIACDVFNNIYVTGSYVDTAYFDNDTLISAGGPVVGDIFIAKYDSLGNFIWSRTAGGNRDYESGNGISSDGSGYIYVAGTFKDTAYFGAIRKISSGLSDIFLAKYDSSGNVIWVETDGVSFNLDEAYAVTTDVSGNSFVAGNYNNQAYVSKYNSGGVLQWFQNSQSGTLEAAHGAAVDSAGYVYITGHFEGALSFIGSNTLFSNGLADVFIARFTPIGNFDWFITGGGNDYDFASAIDVDVGGNILSTGSFTAMADFGNVQLVAKDSIYTAAYFLKAAATSVGVNHVDEEKQLILFPNPARDVVNFSDDYKDGLITINEASGRKVMQVKVNSSQIDISQLAAGVYICAIEKRNEIRKARLVIIE